MRTDRLLLGLLTWGLSMGALILTWGYAIRTAGPRGVVTAPIGLLALGMLIAVVLFIVGIVVLVGAMKSGRPPVVR